MNCQQFRTNNLKKWGAFKAAYLSFHWFNDSWIWTRSSWIWTRNSWIWTRNLWIGTRNSWIWTRTFEFQLVLLRFELVTRVLPISLNYQLVELSIRPNAICGSEQKWKIMTSLKLVLTWKSILRTLRHKASVYW